MAKDWSDNIIIADLGDEPGLSEELAATYERVAHADADDAPHVILNFTQVTYLNSSNIAQMLRLRKRLNELEQRLMICSVADPVWSVMLLTGLDKVFSFAPDTATAIASLQLEGDTGAA